jgi:O-antigen/teichoic acid export membrane protein
MSYSLFLWVFARPGPVGRHSRLRQRKSPGPRIELICTPAMLPAGPAGTRGQGRRISAENALKSWSAMSFGNGSALNQSSNTESAATIETLPEKEKPRKIAATFAQNSFINLIRTFLTAAIALVLPAYLTHRLSVQTYSAWVLILQLGAYVNYLDFGIQTGISKYVAEYEARKDAAGASMHASAGLLLMLATSIVGLGLTLVLACQVPHLFHDMPGGLYRDVRLSIVFVGFSLSFGLVCSSFSAIFYGLQRYAAPTSILVINRLLYAAVIVAAVACHRSLAVMGALVAAVNVFTGLLQIEAWRRWASNVQVSLRKIDLSLVWKIFGYCSALAVWTAGMLCVSGLDVTIVGKYDFGQTGFYSVATLPTNFIIAILGAALAPLLPSVSALSVLRSPRELGAILARVTRYTSTILLVTGLPLIVAGYWILSVWVGAGYAIHTIGYLRILLLANILRSTCSPYASMLVATNSQRVAIAGAIAEAVTNVAASIYLAAHIGAIGVAYGTLIGSFVSVGAHLLFNMRHTMDKFEISRLRLFLSGLIRPGIIAVPSLLLAPWWWPYPAPVFNREIWFGWMLTTLLLVWLAGLSARDRDDLAAFVHRKLRGRPCYN